MNENNSILLINDEETMSGYIKEKLINNCGCSICVESNAASGLESFKQNHFDLVLVKFDMPQMPGEEVLKSLKQIDSECIVIAIVSQSGSSVMNGMTNLGIYDILTTPIDLGKLYFLIKKGIELNQRINIYRKLSQGFKEQNIALQKQNLLLAHRIEESTRNLARLYEDLRSTYLRTIKALAQAIDARDHYTHRHSENVAKYASIIAEQLQLSVNQTEKIREACELHDLGKIGIGDQILTKTSGLTDQEWESIKCHPLIGAQILEPLTFLGEVIDLIKQHHEHYDGTGYPSGLKAEEILLGARIINLADAYEAMRSARSYRQKPLSKEEAVWEIKKNSGTQFDPEVVKAFLSVIEKFP